MSGYIEMLFCVKIKSLFDDTIFVCMNNLDEITFDCLFVYLFVFVHV